MQPRATGEQSRQIFEKGARIRIEQEFAEYFTGEGTIDLVNLVQILFGDFMFSFSQLPVTSSHTSVYSPKIIIAKELFTHTSNCMGVNLSHNVSSLIPVTVWE